MGFQVLTHFFFLFLNFFFCLLFWFFPQYSHITGHSKFFPYKRGFLCTDRTFFSFSYLKRHMGENGILLRYILYLYLFCSVLFYLVSCLKTPRTHALAQNTFKHKTPYIKMLPAGVILVFVLVGLAAIAVICTIMYRKWQAKQRGLQKF